MKKIMITGIVVLGAFLMAACSKVESEQQPENKMTVIKGIIDDDATKTSLDGVSVLWSDGDAVALVSDTDFTITNCTSDNSGSNTNQTLFIGYLKSGDKFAAFYPASRSWIDGNGNFQVSIPHEQTYVSGGISNNLLPMYAIGTSLDNMSFNYFGSIIRLQLYSDPEENVQISQIDITVKNLSRSIAQRSIVPVTLTETNAGSWEPTYTFSLDCDEVTLSKDVDNPTIFNIVVFGSVTASDGFDVKITTANDEIMSFSKSSSITFVRGKIHKFPVKKYAKDPADYNKEISFDKGAHWIKLDNCDALPDPTTCTNVYVRTLSTTKLTSVDVDKILGLVATSVNPIELNFSQSQYVSTTFRTISTSPNKISNLSGLPSNIEVLPANAVNTLPVVNLKNGTLTTIGAHANNTTWKSIEIPATVTSLAGILLRYGNSITVEDGNTAYKVEDNVLFTKSGERLISYPCSRTVASYEVPSGVTNISSGGFRFFNYLHTVTFPASLISIGEYNLEGTITEIHCLGSTPPSLPSTSYVRLPGTGGPYKVYVPSGSKATYDEAWAAFLAAKTNWSIEEVGGGE